MEKNNCRINENKKDLIFNGELFDTLDKNSETAKLLKTMNERSELNNVFIPPKSGILITNGGEHRIVFSNGETFILKSDLNNFYTSDVRFCGVAKIFFENGDMFFLHGFGPKNFYELLDYGTKEKSPVKSAILYINSSTLNSDNGNYSLYKGMYYNNLLSLTSSVHIEDIRYNEIISLDIKNK